MVMMSFGIALEVVAQAASNFLSKHPNKDATRTTDPKNSALGVFSDTENTEESHAKNPSD
ncbi:MAG: hypothetical protein ACRETN_00110 [Nevskiales bacterium]